MSKLTPESVTSNRGTLLDDLEHGLQIGGVPAYPVVFAREERSAGGFDKSNVLLELACIDWVHMIREDIDFLDAEVSLIDAVCSVDCTHVVNMEGKTHKLGLQPRKIVRALSYIIPTY